MMIVRLSGHPLVQDSLSHIIDLHYAFTCCELANTFNVLIWRVMLDLRKALPDRSASRV